MQELSDKILRARKNLNDISPDALKNDPLDQKILKCAKLTGRNGRQRRVSG